MGLVNRVVPSEQIRAEAIAYAGDLAANYSPESMAVIKRQVYAPSDQVFAAALEESVQLMEKSLSNDDFREGVNSYIERRPPRFRPLAGSHRDPFGGSH